MPFIMFFPFFDIYGRKNLNVIIYNIFPFLFNKKCSYGSPTTRLLATEVDGGSAGSYINEHGEGDNFGL